MRLDVVQKVPASIVSFPDWGLGTRLEPVEKHTSFHQVHRHLHTITAVFMMSLNILF